MSVVCDCDCVGFEASQVPRGEDRPTTRMTIMRKRHRDRNRKKKKKTLSEMSHKKAMETPEEWIGLL